MKKILFVCVENSCRSQMAEAIAKDLDKGKILAYSAGSRPSGKVNDIAIDVMKEIGLDISRAESKGFDDLLEKEFDYVITMGCEDTCPFIPSKEYLNWDLEDPKYKDISFFRKIRDEIKEKVIELLKDI